APRGIFAARPVAPRQRHDVQLRSNARPRRPATRSRRTFGCGLLVLAAAALAAGAASAATLQGHVTPGVGGDTGEGGGRGAETTARLIGIDPPETVRPGTPVECFGPAASARTKLLLRPGQAVRLVTDPTQDVRDRYGRLLAYVYEPGRTGARASVNYALVAGG